MPIISLVTHKILLADDNPNILSFVQPALEREGYHVITAADGAEALYRWETEHPALRTLTSRRWRSWRKWCETAETLMPVARARLVTLISAWVSSHSRRTRLASPNTESRSAARAARLGRRDCRRSGIR